MTMPQQGCRVERVTDKRQLVNNLLICAAQLAKYRAGTNVCCGSYVRAKHSAGATMSGQKPGNLVLQRGENDLRDWYVIGFIVFVSSLVIWLPLLGVGR